MNNGLIEKSNNIISKIKINGFLSYFVSNFSFLYDLDQVINNFQRVIEITKTEDSHKWINENKLIIFKINENLSWDIINNVPLIKEKNNNDEIIIQNIKNITFWIYFIKNYCQKIQYKNIQKFINITKDEYKNFWIIDKNNQIVYLKFRNLCGEGSVKRTYLGWDVTKDKSIVVYQINVSSNNTEQKRCLNEKRIAEIQKSPYLLTIYYSMAQKETRKTYMIADYYKYNIRQMILDNHKWTIEELKTFSKNILKGLKVLHDMNIIHRDVKPSNIIYDDEKNLYLLIDFGISTKFTSGIQLNKIETLNCHSDCHNLSLLGTPGYISPEMYQPLYSVKKIKYNYSVDIFSFGITLLEMFVGKRAFQEDFEFLPESIQHDLFLKESQFKDILNNDTIFLQKLHKNLDEFIKTKKFETLRNEIQEKIDIINQLNLCDFDDKEIFLAELIDKNKTIINCCQSFQNNNLKDLDENTSTEYEFISQMKILQSYSKKINKYFNSSIDEIVNDFQFYPLLFMTSNYTFPKCLNQIEDPIFKDFLQKCLDKNPKNRFLTNDLLNHEWLN